MMLCRASRVRPGNRLLHQDIVCEVIAVRPAGEVATGAGAWIPALAIDWVDPASVLPSGLFGRIGSFKVPVHNTVMKLPERGTLAAALGRVRVRRHLPRGGGLVVVGGQELEELPGLVAEADGDVAARA